MARIAESVKQRDATDEIVKGWWNYLPFGAVAAGLVVAALFYSYMPTLSGLILALFFMFTLGFALVAILNYKLVRRLNEHRKRETTLRTGLIEYIRAMGHERGQEAQVISEISAMESIDLECLDNERPFSVMATPMTALPLIGFAFEYYSLRAATVPAYMHDKRWQLLMQQLRSASDKLGIDPIFSASKPLPLRPFPLYLILSLLFFPFLAYWYYVLIMDMNGHLKAQWVVEDNLLSRLI